MALISEILEEEAARMYALTQLRDAVRSVMPNRVPLLEDSNEAVITTPYIVYDQLGDLNISGGLSDKPRFYEMEDNGTETYVYDGRLLVELSTYIGNAYTDLKTIKTALRNKRIKQTYFTDTGGLVGIMDIRHIIDSPVLVYEQEMQPCARLQLTLSYVYKVVDTGGDVVDTIMYNGKVTVAGEESPYDGISPQP